MADDGCCKCKTCVNYSKDRTVPKQYTWYVIWTMVAGLLLCVPNLSVMGLGIGTYIAAFMYLHQSTKW